MSTPEKLEQYKRARKHPRGPVKRLYTMPEAAYYLGRTVNALRQIVWSGKLPYVKDGRRVLLDVRDLDSFIEENKTRFAY